MKEKSYGQMRVKTQDWKTGTECHTVDMTNRIDVRRAIYEAVMKLAPDETFILDIEFRVAASVMTDPGGTPSYRTVVPSEWRAFIGQASEDVAAHSSDAASAETMKNIDDFVKSSKDK